MTEWLELGSSGTNIHVQLVLIEQSSQGLVPWKSPMVMEKVPEQYTF